MKWAKLYRQYKRKYKTKKHINISSYFFNSEKNPCEPNPCKCGGRCSATSDSTYDCLCDQKGHKYDKVNGCKGEKYFSIRLPPPLNYHGSKPRNFTAGYDIPIVIVIQHALAGGPWRFVWNCKVFRIAAFSGTVAST